MPAFAHRLFPTDRTGKATASATMYFLAACILLGSCSPEAPGHETLDAPEAIREKAYTIATFYLGMEYEWGGQTHWSSRGVDCSGLVVNVYQEAVAGTPYLVPYQDAAVVHFLSDYTIPVEAPERGDLIFMGDGDDISHIAILEKIENGTVWFIDASSASGTVMYRSYQEDNEKIKSYGRHLLWREVR